MEASQPSAGPAPVVSIIIVTYNALEYVRRCLETLRTTRGTPHEILVIDNASRPEVREFLKTQPGIRLILNEENTLWCAACNQGMREAHPESRYFLLLNPDIEVQRPDWLDILVRTMESDPSVGMVGTYHQYRDAGPIYGWIDGQCLMIRRELIGELGYFDCARFPMGGAPVLFTIQAFKRGWRYRVVHEQDRLLVHHLAKSRAEYTGPKPWKDQRLVYEDLMREQGVEPELPSPVVRLLHHKFPALRARGRFFYTPPTPGDGRT